MNLLLLLSALLSALTGAGLGVRAVQPEQTISRPVSADAAASATRVVSLVRPMPAVPTLAQSAAAPLSVVWRLADAVPLFLSRRRE